MSIKRCKTLSIYFLTIAIFFIVIGMGFSKLSNINKGVSITRVNSYTGEVVKGRIGGNSKGRETTNALSIVFYLDGVIFSVVAAVFKIKSRKIEALPLKYIQGKVLEKQNNSTVFVELADGTRKKCIIEPDILLTEGDVKNIGFKGNNIVDVK